MNASSGKPIIVAIVGAGGLGIPAAWGLLSQWKSDTALVLRLFDPDLVELSNLPRQVLYTDDDLGKAKVIALAERLRTVSGERHSIIPERVTIGAANIAENLRGVSFVIDATDSVETKFLINDFCVAGKIPFCYGGAVGLGGQMLAVDPSSSECGCLRCLFGEVGAAELGPVCREAGILGPVAGTIGFLQAEHCARFLEDGKFPRPESLLVRFDSTRGIVEEVSVKPQPHCPLFCGTERRLLDLTAEQCPRTFLYTKLALEQLSGNEALDVQFGNLDSVKNVSETVLEHGYLPLGPGREIAKDRWRLVVAKGGIE